MRRRRPETRRSGRPTPVAVARQILAAGLVAAAAAVGACGSTKPCAPLVEAIAPATALEACQQLSAIAAEYDARCSGGTIEDWQEYWTVQSACDTFDRHVGEGTAEYRPAGWNACLQKYAKPCGQARPYPCYYEILHGTVADGQSCSDVHVCGTVSSCLDVSVGGQACGDVCARPAAENEACGLYCGGATPCFDVAFCGLDLTCSNGVCRRDRPFAQPCGGPDAIGCLYPLACDIDPTQTSSIGVCVRRIAGGPCRSEAACPLDEFCLDGTCAPRRGLGFPCADGPNGGCLPWTVCDLRSQHCVPAGRLGEPCALLPGGSSRASSCIEGSCLGGTCVAVRTPGQRCSDGGCAQGAFCDTPTNMCLVCPQ